MKIVGLLSLLGLILMLGACGDNKVAIRVTHTVVVEPDAASYEHCPQYIEIPTVSDTNSGVSGILTVYGAYQQCRQTVEDIRKEIARLKAIAERDNVPEKK